MIFALKRIAVLGGITLGGWFVFYVILAVCYVIGGPHG